MAYLQIDENGNPIWIPDVDALAQDQGQPGMNPPVPTLAGAASAPAGSPAPGPSPEDMAARALAGINADLSPGRGPAVGNQVPNGSPYAAAPEDPYAAPPGPATVDRQFTPGGQQIAGTIAQPGQLGGPDPARPTPPLDPVAQADADQLGLVDQRMALEQQAIDADMEAQRSLASRKAAVQTEHVNAMATADRDYQTARTAALADAERETAEWQLALEKKSKEEPSRSRWWENTSDFGKALWLMSLAFGTYGASKAPGIQNVAMKMIQEQIASDVTQQKARLEREIEALRGRKSDVDRRRASQLAALSEDHTMVYQRLIGLRDAALEKAQAPGTADQRAAYGKAALAAQAQLEQIAQQRSQRAFQARESQLDREAETARNSARLWTQRKLAELEVGYKTWETGVEDRRARDLAQISIDARAAGKGSSGPFKPEDVRAVPVQTGFKVVDDATGEAVGPNEGAFRVVKENEKEARDVADLANEKFAAMQRVAAHLSADEDFDDLLKRDPQFEKDIIILGYGESKELDPRAITTDKDLIAGMRASIGADFNSTTGRLAVTTGIGANQERLKTFIDKAIRDYPKKVSAKMMALMDPQLEGYGKSTVRIDWSPRSVEQDAAAPKTGSQTDADYGVSRPLPKLETPEDLKRNRALGEDALPKYQKDNESKVKAFERGAQYSTPAQIRDRAVKALESVRGDKRAELTIQETVDEATQRQAARLRELEDDILVQESLKRRGDEVRRISGGRVGPVVSTKQRTDADRAADARKLAVDNGLGDIPPDDLLRLIEKVNRRLDEESDVGRRKVHNFRKYQ